MDRKRALVWIVGILKKNKIPFQVVGGLAARAWGSKRELWDIDLIVPEEALGKLADLTKDYGVEGPDYSKSDESWQNYSYLELNYNEQNIEIAATTEETKIFDKQTKKWTPWIVDFSKSVMKEVEGLELPVMPLKSLLDYKKKLNRKVDKIDIMELTK